MCFSSTSEVRGQQQLAGILLDTRLLLGLLRVRQSRALMLLRLLLLDQQSFLTLHSCICTLVVSCSCTY
jgi:hypothetical protein